MSRNLYYANNRDLFVEVSHGPFLVDHNIFASNASLESWSQGGAYVHNLVCGTVWLNPVPERYWSYTGSIQMMRELMQDRMYPLTLAGLDEAMCTLSRKG